MGLTAEAQDLFAALAAFGSMDFGRNAAIGLGEGLAFSRSQAEAASDLLVHHALLAPFLNEAMPPDSDRERRRLHPVLRAFAHTLFRHGDTSWTDERRAAAYGAVARYYAKYTNMVVWQALGQDESNILAALEWAHANSEYRLVNWLCLGMRNYWRETGRREEALRYLPWAIDAAMAVAASTNDARDFGYAARQSAEYARSLWRAGTAGEAEEYYERSAALARQSHDLFLLAHILRQWGWFLFQVRGENERASRLLHEASSLYYDVHRPVEASRTAHMADFVRARQ
jgi:tetratricopeptide (TPR) repeat protein